MEYLLETQLESRGKAVGVVDIVPLNDNGCMIRHFLVGLLFGADLMNGASNLYYIGVCITSNRREVNANYSLCFPFVDFVTRGD